MPGPAVGDHRPMSVNSEKLDNHPGAPDRSFGHFNACPVDNRRNHIPGPSTQEISLEGIRMLPEFAAVEGRDGTFVCRRGRKFELCTRVVSPGAVFLGGRLEAR